MSWIGRLFGMSAGSGNRDPGNDFWYERAPAHAMALPRIPVTAETVRSIPAVQDGMAAITNPIASLPFQLFRRVSDNKKLPAPEHPAAKLLRRPAEGWTRFQWRAFQQDNLSLHRNAYAEIVPGMGSAIAELRPIHPSYVTPERRGGRVWFRVQDPNGGQVRSLRDDEIWHMKAGPFTTDGLCGVPIYCTHRETFAHALAVAEYGARFFENDGQAGGFVFLDQPFKTPEDREKFKRAFKKARTGAEAHQIGLIDFPGKFEKGPERNNEHAQFLETRKESAIDIARILNVPPHKIRALDRATNNNIESQAIEFVVDSFLPVGCNWEDGFNTNIVDPLTVDGDEYFAEYNVAGLLRGDMKKQAEAFQAGIQSGWYSINDVRAMLNRNPVEGGDSYLRPLNMEPVGAAPDTGSPDSNNASTGERPRLVAAGDD